MKKFVHGRSVVLIDHVLAIPIPRYCAKLPSDAFTHLTPYCALVAVEDPSSPQYYATLRLPINSPVKEEVKVGTYKIYINLDQQNINTYKNL